MIHNQKGFSLVETVIAMVIIGIITGMLIFLINSSSNAQRKTNANIKILTELSNIYNAFSSIKDINHLISFLEENEYYVEVEGNTVKLYFNSRMEKLDQEAKLDQKVSKGYQIICKIEKTPSSNEAELGYIEYTLATSVKYPERSEPEELISPRTIRVRVEE